MDEHENGCDELTPAERANLERHHPDALAQHDQRRQTKDLPFEPKGSAPQRHETSDPHTERMRLSKILADPSRTAVLDAGFKNRAEALNRLEELAKLASGSAAQGDKQAMADADMQPGSVNEYTGFDTPKGNAWTEESREELGEIKRELFEAGVNPGAARAVFSELPGFFEMDEEQHYGRVETAVNTFKQVNGEDAFKDVQRFVRSLSSDNMKTAALVAGMSQLGLKEMARLGRQLGRKAAH